MPPTLFVSHKGEVQTELPLSLYSGSREKERDGKDVSKCPEMLLSDEAGASPVTLLRQMLGTRCPALAWDWDRLSPEAENGPEPRGPASGDDNIALPQVVVLQNQNSAASKD